MFVGALFSLSRRRSIAVLILIASSYLPIAFIVLASRGYGPPPPWWLLFLVNLAVIFLSSIRIAQLTSNREVTPWQR
jgi:predicted membrane channel-forming protein YqfA (hemolysin III family)